MEKINKVQGYNLTHEEIAHKMDDLEFWKAAAEEAYLDLKYVQMNKPSSKEGKFRKAKPCTITKEEFLKEYESHIQRMKQKFPENDGRLCRYCYLHSLVSFCYLKSFGVKRRLVWIRTGFQEKVQKYLCGL